MKTLVPDSSCLIALRHLGHSGLLASLSPQVLITSQVLAEARPNAFAFEEANPPLHLVRHYEIGPPSLDAGEASVIALASTLDSVVTIIDEARGRRVARSANVPVIGTLAVLVRAKRAKLVDEVAPLIEDLLDFGFRASTQVVKQALELAGEA